MSNIARLILGLGVAILVILAIRGCNKEPSRDEIIQSWVKNGTLQVKTLMFKEEYLAQEFANEIKWQIINQGYYFDGENKIYKAVKKGNEVTIYTTK